MQIRNGLIIGVAIFGAIVQVAKADERDQKTVVTFSVPVEIPGQVLSPGTYVFKLADSSSDRNIVQVFNKEESHLYGTFLAVPDYRLRPADKPIITFSERPAGTPEAVRAWFYPGQNYGHDFVYPKPKAAALAKANQTPVPSMPAELEPNTTMPAKTTQEPQVVAMKTAPLKAQTPTEDEVELAEVFTVEQVQAPIADTPPAQLPAQLPKTASGLPLIGVGGLLCLAAALALRKA
ncbi:MAG TPA: hypothetical protein VGG72_20175 [Bryobacteraceae bacterium]|jgi:hypothetical protein